MAARSVFLEVGIDPRRLTLRLLPATSADARSGAVLRIVPSREEPLLEPTPTSERTEP